MEIYWVIKWRSHISINVIYQSTLISIAFFKETILFRDNFPLKRLNTSHKPIKSKTLKKSQYALSFFIHRVHKTNRQQTEISAKLAVFIFNWKSLDLDP